MYDKTIILQTNHSDIKICVHDFVKYKNYAEGELIYHDKNLYRAKKCFCTKSKWNEDDWELVESAQVNADWDATEGVAKILNKPAIPPAQVNADWDATSGIEQILNKPTIIDDSNETSLTTTLSANKISEKISNLNIDLYVIVQTLPAVADGEFNKIYLVPNYDTDGVTILNYNEYILINTGTKLAPVLSWEEIGVLSTSTSGKLYRHNVMCVNSASDMSIIDIYSTTSEPINTKTKVIDALSNGASGFTIATGILDGIVVTELGVINGDMSINVYKAGYGSAVKKEYTSYNDHVSLIK
ncbi:hypothetical protein FACS1894195_0060 [Bacteroidia bacterium]|nr:hypothetical protein FACS1894195_0060 [Bacteroidia bacterium]